MSFNRSELDILVYWMTERDRIRALKESGAPKPWTTDPLLRDYRWCNVKRMDDRVSRWLVEQWYNPRDEAAWQLIDAVYARLINWPEALDEIADSRHPLHARAILAERASRGDKVFTGAYVIPGTPGRDKVDSVLHLVERVTDHADDLANCGSMQATWRALLNLEGLGSFLAGQIVADLAHLGLGLDWPDRETWAPIGPGSRRGINRLLGRSKNNALTQAEFESILRALMLELRPRVADLWRERGLVAMDVQNCLCEFDKYRRLTLGEGKVRARYDGRAGNQQEALL